MKKGILLFILLLWLGSLTDLVRQFVQLSGAGVMAQVEVDDGQERDRLGQIAASPAITFTEVITGLTNPTDIANAGDGRLFIVEKVGLIHIFDGTSLLATPFLDISTLVTSGSERGLLGLVFHPDYANNGYFYVNFTFGTNGDTRIARYQVSAGDPNIANPASATTILEVVQDFANHNGGDLNFGPDGYLYIALGDGGSGGDPNDRAQTNTQLLGKILRIDVDQSGGAECDVSGFSNYDIPPGNPFVDGAGGNCDEIWHTGLRNPWRFSFDRLTGDMWIGDVGQGEWEEVDFQPAASSGGQNWGWRCYEGNNVYNTSGCGPASSYDFPVHDYSSGSGSGNCSVTGGFVYRGSDVPALFGHYLFADYCSERIWSLSATSQTQLTTFGPPNTGSVVLDRPTTFGEDMDGELYVAENGMNASIFKLTAVSCDLCNAGQNIPLYSGWNMISGFVDPNNPALETLLAGIEPDMVLLKNEDGEVYWPDLAINTIGSWDLFDGYQVNMNDTAVLSLTGMQADPAQSALDMTSGWNLIAYLRDNDMAISQALAGISGDLLLAKNGEGEVYWPSFGVNDIGDMQPGLGYQVYMSGPGSLVYPAN